MKVTYTPTNQKQIEKYLKKGDPTLLNPTVSIEHPTTLSLQVNEVALAPAAHGLGLIGAVARVVVGKVEGIVRVPDVVVQVQRHALHAAFR